MRAGQLRHRLEVQAATETKNTDGETISTWSEVASIWAEVVPASGGESFAARELSADVQYQVRTRYRSGITPKMRGVGRTGPFTGLVFDFLNVLPTDGRMAEMTITAVVRDV